MKASPAPTLSERDFQRTVIDCAHALKWTVFHVHDSRREVVRQDGARFFVGDKEAAGFPDLVLARERVVYAELKSESGRLSKAQLHWLGVLNSAGQETYVWRPSAWPQIETVLA